MRCDGEDQGETIDLFLLLSPHTSLFLFHFRPLLTIPLGAHLIPGGQHRPCLPGHLARPLRARLLLSPSLPSLSVPMPAQTLPLASGAFPHGQGLYQIVEGQIIQAVPAASANLFGTTEMALGCLAELSMLSLSIVFHDPKYFGALVLMSLAGVVGAAVLYCSWLAFPDPRLQILFPNQPKVQWGNVIWWGMGQGESQGEKPKGKGFVG
ncbi:unnamed protein product [Closterium sp. NIES-54]